jgi:hypothetical protein
MHDKNDDVYSHVAVSVEARLLKALEARWQRSIERYRRERNTTGLLAVAS